MIGAHPQPTQMARQLLAIGEQLPEACSLHSSLALHTTRGIESRGSTSEEAHVCGFGASRLSIWLAAAAAWPKFCNSEILRVAELSAYNGIHCLA